MGKPKITSGAAAVDRSVKVIKAAVNCTQPGAGGKGGKGC